MKYDPEEILKYLCFVILGYFVAMMFSRMCSCGNGYRNGFRVGGEALHACDTYKPEGRRASWTGPEIATYELQCENMHHCGWTSRSRRLGEGEMECLPTHIFTNLTANMELELNALRDEYIEPTNAPGLD